MEEVTINPTIEPPELKQDWGNRLLEGTNKTLCTPGLRDPTETEPDLPLSVLVSPAEALVSSGLPQGQGLWLQQTWEAQHVA